MSDIGTQLAQHEVTLDHHDGRISRLEKDIHGNGSHHGLKTLIERVAVKVDRLSDDFKEHGVGHSSAFVAILSLLGVVLASVISGLFLLVAK